MTTTRIRVMESRPMDSVYDTTFTGPYTQSFTDKRVLSKVSSQTMVAGTTRFKYFKRPVMPQLAAAAPQVLLAPTNEDPLVPIDEVPEPIVKSVEVQTMYRESEAQTNPYTPAFTIPEGSDPEILLLKDLTYEHGLPMGRKEMEMAEHARMKKNLESNVPPFTDEASLNLRKHLMEKQELKEYRFRENEIDAKREEKLGQLRQALMERDESNEYLSSQRVEAVRQTRMEQREKVLDKIRSQRIKVLRRLANERNKVDPVLHETTSRTIIDDHFDKSSSLYAPKRRNGDNIKTDYEKYNILGRTTPFENINTISDLEASIPRRLLNTDDNFTFTQLKAVDIMSKTVPVSTSKGGVNQLVEERLTSATRREIKNTKRNVEEMHKIIQKKKNANNAENVELNDTKLSTYSHMSDSESPSKTMTLSAISRRTKGRPTTPDLTVDDRGETRVQDNKLQAAVILIQSVIRGRAVQNIMIEGRYRRKELIAELRKAAETVNNLSEGVLDSEIIDKMRSERDLKLKTTTEDAIIGGVIANVATQLAMETERQETLKSMQELADAAYEDRRKREAAEAGRRQRENMAYPADPE